MSRSDLFKSLSGTTLTVKQTFLSRAIDPPDIAAVDKALSVLEELAAIGPDGELTALGKHMVCLTVSLVFNFHSRPCILLGDLTDGSPAREGRCISLRHRYLCTILILISYRC